MTKTYTAEVYQLGPGTPPVAATEDSPAQPGTVRAYIRPVSDPMHPAMGGQDVLEYEAGTEPAMWSRITVNSTYTPVA